jgi:hypothetical protein
MSRLPRVFVVVGLSLIATLGVGCKQGEGERCELNSDCADGLECDREGVSGEASICVVPGGGQEPDASVEDDAGTTGDDAGTDAADDAGGTDGGGTDGGATDGATDAPMTGEGGASDAPADMSTASDAGTD